MLFKGLLNIASTVFDVKKNKTKGVVQDTFADPLPLPF